jgi:CRP-like cAMP-binding protein
LDFELLASLPDAERRAVIAEARRKRFAKGEVIFHEGDPGGTLHLVAQGRVAVRIGTPTGDHLILRVIDEGGWFGELSLICPSERNATIVALEPVQTLLIHTEAAQQLRQRVPGFDDLMLKALVAEVRRLSTALLEVVFVPVPTRIYRHLSALERLYRSKDDATPTTIPLTQEELAQLVGTTRPTLNRQLQLAAKAGIVQIHRGSIEVLDRSAIEAKAR